MDVSYPGFGVILVGGVRYQHDVVVEDGVARARDKKPSKRLAAGTGHTPLSLAEAIPWSRPTLIVGTGHLGRLPVLPEVEEEARSRGVMLKMAPTGQACDLLADLEPSEANAILHVTC